MSLRPMAPTSLDELHTVEAGSSREYADVRETLSPNSFSVRFILREDRQRLRQYLARFFIPIVFVQMGDDHRVHINDFFLRHWKLHEGIALLAVNCPLKARPAMSIRQHWIDKEANTAINDVKSCIAYLRDCHASLRHSGALCAYRKRTGNERSACKGEQFPRCGHESFLPNRLSE
ncbi:hypothetical protein CO668_29830 [Rhizobium anhuiense]|nr:hypothetical protein CO668_29830 [Rhizobium anhuiense]